MPRPRRRSRSVPARRCRRRPGCRRCPGRASRESMRPRPSPPRRGPPDRPPDDRRAAAMPSAPASSAPRSPARRGTQASAAPVASTRSPTAVSRPGVCGGPLADQDHRAGGAQQRAEPVPLGGVGHSVIGQGVAGQPGQHAGSSPGAAPISVPDILCQAVARQRAPPRTRPAPCGRPCAAAGTGSAIPPRAPARPAAPPTPSPARRSVTPPRSGDVPATRAPRNAASSAECARARKSMSLVRSASRANLA